MTYETERKASDAGHTGADVQIRRLTEEEIPAALELAREVFLEYETPDYSPEGTEEFMKSIADESYLAGMIYYGAFAGEELAGMLGIKENSGHICLFFVKGQYHRRGIGTMLFRRMEEDYAGQTVTLNSSPYGLPFYKALGCTATDSEQTVNGIRFTPMEYTVRQEAEPEA